jgi:DNA-binding transcriptional MocR family regulator
MFKFEFRNGSPLVAQIVDGLVHLIDSEQLRTGAKLPSIRQFAHSNGVSVFTVVEAYDRLVALGYTVSRLNAGFFVCQRSTAPLIPAAPALPVALSSSSFDNHWYSQRIFENQHLPIKAGCDWLPESWLFEAGVRRAMRQLTANDPMALGGYGEPLGYLPLRQRICSNLYQQAITVQPHQVLLTHGASQALDLAVRRWVTPGDIVLVDEPGHPNLNSSLRLAGAVLQGIPRSPQGWDLAVLEASVKRLRPKLFFTQPRLHSPSGSVASQQQLYQVLRIAEMHDMLLIENDSYGDLDAEPRPTLASLDNLARVIYVGSFSNSLAPSLRSGYLLAHADTMPDLAQLKMLAGLTSSELIERIVHLALCDSHRPRHVRSLHARLSQAHAGCAAQLRNLGFTLFSEPKAGLFLWAWHPRIPNPATLAVFASTQGVMLGPGHLFTTTQSAHPWMRFNVAQCQDNSAALYAWLGEWLTQGFAAL